MPRVLLLLPSGTYRADDFLIAAQKLGVDLIVGSEKPSALQRLNPASFLLLDHGSPYEWVSRLRALVRDRPLDAVVPVDSALALEGAIATRALRLPGNSPDAIAAALNKRAQRRRLAASGVPQPDFAAGYFGQPLPDWTAFPGVVKPLTLSGSQGVMRVDGPSELAAAVRRLQLILETARQRPDRSAGEASPGGYLIEEFVSGSEYSLEGLVTRGRLQLLALFDKPEPLEGPYFEETIYVTPSALPVETREMLRETVERGCRALGLLHGPIHAEVRLGVAGPKIIEINPRSIGGLCSRTLRFGLNASLEELILRHALQGEVELPELEATASGVLMIPTPAAGTLIEYHGIDRAQSVPGVEQVVITAHRQKRLQPLPEGSDYLGFVFARGPSPGEVIRTLKVAQEHLQFVIAS